MENTVIYLTVVYLLTYRLSVLLLGGGSIYLGYRLFIKGFNQTTGEHGEMSAKIGTVDLTLKNAAPGIFFAAFGAIITTSILMGAPPELTHSVLRDNNQEVTSPEIKNDRQLMVKQAKLVAKGVPAKEFHDQIWKSHIPEAVKLAQEAIRNDPDNPNYHDTLATLYFAVEKFNQAKKQQEIAIEKAIKNNVTVEGVDSLRKKLDIYRQFSS